MSNNNHIISEIEQYMLPYLDNEQLEHLRKILSSLLIDQKKTTDEADKTSKNESVNKDIVLSIQIPNTSISIQKEYSNFVKQIDKSKFNVFQDQTAAQVKVIVVLHHIC